MFGDQICLADAITIYLYSNLHRNYYCNYTYHKRVEWTHLKLHSTPIY